MRHDRVQLIGGIILHQGRIAEMRTGEGKTLVSTLPAYLNALEEKGVHIVTVNDYLAKRDAEWMGKVHEFLGLTVGVVLNDMDNDERRAAYASGRISSSVSPSLRRSLNSLVLSFNSASESAFISGSSASMRSTIG